MLATEKAGARPGNHATALLAEADRLMTVCNSCRYCEGLCAVFPAMEMRRAFPDGDLNYLANLCHGCGACYDDCRTEGITPAKTHWARRIEKPPFYAYPVRPGITFTYLGTRVNKEARMLMKDGRPSANMFAAGEIMAGNVLGRGYAAGIGMTIGSVFGRIAGREAAANARN